LVQKHTFSIDISKAVPSKGFQKMIGLVIMETPKQAPAKATKPKKAKKAAQKEL
jgi:hypothetical protein